MIRQFVALGFESRTKFACGTIIVSSVVTALLLRFAAALAFLVIVVVPVAMLLVATWPVVAGWIDAWQSRDDRRQAVALVVVPPIAVLLALTAFLPAGWTTWAILDYATLGFVHSRMAELAADPPEDTLVRGTWDDSRYSLDAGPPVRVAYATDPGFLDNWSAIIFDPSGAVAQANGFTGAGGFTAPEPVKTLFGGDIVSCRWLIGHYYSCSFT